MSRQNVPKQFLKLTEDKTLLQATYERVKEIVPAQRIYVVITEKHERTAREQLPNIPSQNFIIEPLGKNTAPAIGLATAYIVRHNKKAVIASLAADHHVSKPKEFQRILTNAFQTAQKNSERIVTVGIKPTYPETAYGYIQIGKQFENGVIPIYNVKRFVEKPDSKTAQKYFESFEYLWNASYFIYTGQYMIKALKNHAPLLSQSFQAIKRSLGTDQYAKTLVENYESMPTEAIDTAVMEKEKTTLVIPADIGWSDVGSWASLHDVLASTHGSDVIVQGHHIGVDTVGSLIFAREKLVATVGLKDTIVVDTPDVLLVVDKSRSQDIKKIIERLKEEGKHLYL
jgi:mannose-1-phosphate guanylyltransferase